MKKGLVLAGAWMMTFLLAGCGSESKEIGLVTHVIELLDQTTAKVSALTTALDEAIKKAKADPDKGINLTAATVACDSLKSHCKKELQPESLKIQSLQASTSEEEKKRLKERYQTDIEAKISKLNEKRLLLADKLKELQALSQEANFQGSREAVDTFITKTYAEAQEEYNSLNRQIR